MALENGPDFRPNLRQLRGDWGFPPDDEEDDEVDPDPPSPLLTYNFRPWPKIRPFEIAKLPDFPTQQLPPVLRDWVAAESRATQTPADLAGLLAPASCSAAVARNVEVDRPLGREPVNLFVSVLLDAGDRKSAVFRDAFAPLREFEAQQIKVGRDSVARARSLRRQLQLRLRMLERDVLQYIVPGKGQREACDCAVQLANFREPVIPRLLVDEAAGDKLVSLLADHHRIASISPEGGVFDLLAARRGLGQLGVYQHAHAGHDFTTDRLARDGLSIERPALTCAVSPQPALVKGLAQSPTFRGHGLLARFLYAVPTSLLGRREVSPAPMPAGVRAAYRDTLRRLAELESGQVLTLDADADVVMQLWEMEIEELLADGGSLENLREWGSQLAGATLRIAALLHLAEHASLTIGETTLYAAIEIARYLIPHAAAALSLMEARDNTLESDARWVLRWIERHGRREFTKRDAQQHGRRRFPRASDIDLALDELVARGYIRVPAQTAGVAGRPASPSYQVNPLVFGDAPPVWRSDPSVRPYQPTCRPWRSENIESAPARSESAVVSTPTPESASEPALVDVVSAPVSPSSETFESAPFEIPREVLSTPREVVRVPAWLEAAWPSRSASRFEHTWKPDA